MIPPPTPISAPKRPAPNPMVINRIIINSNKIHTLIHNIFQSGKALVIKYSSIPNY